MTLTKSSYGYLNHMYETHLPKREVSRHYSTIDSNLNPNPTLFYDYRPKFKHWERIDKTSSTESIGRSTCQSIQMLKSQRSKDNLPMRRRWGKCFKSMLIRRRTSLRATIDWPERISAFGSRSTKASIRESEERRSCKISPITVLMSSRHSYSSRQEMSTWPRQKELSPFKTTRPSMNWWRRRRLLLQTQRPLMQCLNTSKREEQSVKLEPPRNSKITNSTMCDVTSPHSNLNTI